MKKEFWHYMEEVNNKDLQIQNESIENIIIGFMLSALPVVEYGHYTLNKKIENSNEWEELKKEVSSNLNTEKQELIKEILTLLKDEGYQVTKDTTLSEVKRITGEIQSKINNNRIGNPAQSQENIELIKKKLDKLFPSLIKKIKNFFTSSKSK